MKKMSAVDWVAFILVIIGGINWGLIGVFNYNVVVRVFGAGTQATRVIYGLIGLSAIYLLISGLMSAGKKK